MPSRLAVVYKKTKRCLALRTGLEPGTYGATGGRPVTWEGPRDVRNPGVRQVRSDSRSKYSVSLPFSRRVPCSGLRFGKRFGCGSEVRGTKKRRYKSSACDRIPGIPGLLIRRSSVRVTQGPPVHPEG